MPAGRPSEYLPENCEVVIDLGKAGKSLAQIASHFDVSKATIINWSEVHPEFSTALSRARAHSQTWWENRAQTDGLTREFNGMVWSKSVQARFREDYTERHEVAGAGGGPIQITITPADAKL